MRPYGLIDIFNRKSKKGTHCLKNNTEKLVPKIDDLWNKSENKPEKLHAIQKHLEITHLYHGPVSLKSK